MVADTDDGHGDDAAVPEGDDPAATRTTAPMSEFSVRDAAFGFVVMVVGVVLTFGVPLAVSF